MRGDRSQNGGGAEHAAEIIAMLHKIGCNYRKSPLLRATGIRASACRLRGRSPIPSVRPSGDAATTPSAYSITKRQRFSYDGVSRIARFLSLTPSPAIFLPKALSSSPGKPVAVERNDDLHVAEDGVVGENPLQVDRNTLENQPWQWTTVGVQRSFLTVSSTPRAKKMARSSLSGKGLPSSSVSTNLREK